MGSGTNCESTNISNEGVNADTSTAGVFGDTEDHMDVTMTQERDPEAPVAPVRDPSLAQNRDPEVPVAPERDPSPLPQRIPKRRKLNDRKAVPVNRTDRKVVKANRTDKVKVQKVEESGSSSAESMVSELLVEERKVKSCRPKNSQTKEIQQNVKTLKDQQQKS